ncbi:hypothetical protein IU498_33245 [Nocardia beijingensis]|uniref:hypothetical protein n=1 Tax=Nocardia beijingensis TaxID=95162 RepID=UPI001894E899|nr:hypothetical protein [Nocardia beijingensis]MBF6079500.1 hypothetical protein [Nocardia beijingensis]
MIIGFMMFAATFSSGAFDRRLSMAGYPRVALALAKIACLVVASLVVCSYATAVICCYWSPRQPVLLAAPLFGAAMTYGALGVALGALLRREVEGMFAIAMISCVDMAVQNPIASVGADSELVRWLPSYGAMQASTAAGLSDATPFAVFAVQLAWFRKRAGRAGRFPSAHPLVSSAQDVDPPPRTSHRRTAYYRTDGDRTTGEAVRVTVADQ